MIQPSNQAWQSFGLAVALALVEANEAAIVRDLPAATAEDLWMSEGRSARFGHPLSCGRLPVAVGSFICLVSPAEARRYHDEFFALPAAL